MIRARWQSSPLIIVPTTTSVAAVLGPVKARPGNDGACGQGRATADIDSPVRVGLNTCVGRGEETGFQVEQRNWNGGSGEWCKIYA